MKTEPVWKHEMAFYIEELQFAISVKNLQGYGKKNEIKMRRTKIKTKKMWIASLRIWIFFPFCPTGDTIYECSFRKKTSAMCSGNLCEPEGEVCATWKKDKYL